MKDRSDDVGEVVLRFEEVEELKRVRVLVISMVVMETETYLQCVGRRHSN